MCVTHTQILPIFATHLIFIFSLVSLVLFVFKRDSFVFEYIHVRWIFAHPKKVKVVFHLQSMSLCRNVFFEVISSSKINKNLGVMKRVIYTVDILTATATACLKAQGECHISINILLWVKQTCNWPRPVITWLKTYN